MKDMEFYPSLLQGFTKKQSTALAWTMVFNYLTDGGLLELTKRYRETKDWQWKSRLLCITPACQLNGTGKEAADVVGLTGMAFVDIDGIPTEEIEKTRAKVNADPHTFMSKVSVSGRGLHILAKYSLSPALSKGEGALNATECYAAAFLTVNCYYADLTGYAFDEKCCNINRLMALNHDEKAYYNEKAQALTPSLSPALTPSLSLKGEGDYKIVSSDAISKSNKQALTPSLSLKGEGDYKIASSDATSKSNKQALTPSLSLKGEGDYKIVSSDAISKSNKQALTPSLSLKGEGDYKMASSDAISKSNKQTPSPFRERAGVRADGVRADGVRAAVSIIESHGERYYQGNRHTYLMKCLAMMNKFGVPLSEAERWALSHDLGEKEVRTLVKSVYSLYSSQHGIYEVPEMHTQNCKTLPQNLQTNKLTRSPHAHTCARRSFPDYQWPHFIQQMLDCADSKEQRDVMLLGIFATLGAILGRLVRVKYSHRYWHPTLQVFIVAPPASGKSVISWVRHLAEPLHDKMLVAYDTAKKEYEQQKAKYDNAGKERANLPIPEPPTMRMFLISGNNSSTGILENLADAEGVGLICESEADTLSAAINTDYGNWDDTLRKAFDHDRLSYNRRTNKEYRQIPHPCLGVLICGTPAQVKPLIPSAENGLFSRQIFATLPPVNEFIDQFGDIECDTDSLFTKWGKEWLEALEKVKAQIGCIELRLTKTQRAEFNAHFSQIFHHAGTTQTNTHMKSSVVREAINILRMMEVVAYVRAWEEKAFDFVKTSHLLTPAKAIPSENIKDGVCSSYELSITDADFNAILTMSEPLYRNACDILSLLPDTDVVRKQQSAPELLLSNLPLQFTRKEALEIGSLFGITKENVDVALNRLMADGKLQKPTRGKYEYVFPNDVTSRARVREESV